MLLKVYFGYEFIHLFFPEIENLEGRSSSHKARQYRHSIITLVTIYQYVNSSAIYTVLAHLHSVYNPHNSEIWFSSQHRSYPSSGRLLVHAASQGPTPSTAAAKHWGSVCSTGRRGCCYVEIMQSCKFLSFAMSVNSLLWQYIYTQ